MPEWMPVVIDRGLGAHVWDIDGNRYIEYGQGLRAVTMGHAEPRVTAAAADWLERGAGFSRPSRVELEAAETFLDLIGAESVKFCKDGSSATTAAVKLARAATGRETRRRLRRSPVPVPGRLVYRDHADRRRHPPGRPRPDRDVPLRRPRRARSTCSTRTDRRAW